MAGGKIGKSENPLLIATTFFNVHHPTRHDPLQVVHIKNVHHKNVSRTQEIRQKAMRGLEARREDCEKPIRGLRALGKSREVNESLNCENMKI